MIWESLDNRSMATTNRNKLNRLYAELVPGAPVTSEQLSSFGISADLAVHYVKAGWLKRLARGVYARQGDQLALYPCLLFLQNKVSGLHIGGKSALEWYGVRHYLTQDPVLQLFGLKAASLPTWFSDIFPADYHQKRLFDETDADLLFVEPFEGEQKSPSVSSPERGFLEMLSDVGVRQTLQEARELAESCYTLRANVLQALLEKCTSVKTVRLCLNIGAEIDLPWVKKLDIQRLPTGSRRDWVSQSKDGLLVLKP